MGVNLLLSYAFHGPSHLDTDLAAVRAELQCGRLMVDSGAFTAHTRGRTIRLREYADWLTRWRGAWDYAMNLDVIGDPAASARQCARLHEWGLPVMPVFTIGASLAEFDAMVRDSVYVAVGGLAGRGVGKQTLIDRLRMLQRRAADQGGGIHALGVAATDIVRRTRPYSSDASACSQAFAFGSVVFFDGRQVRSIPLSQRAALVKARDDITAADIPLAELLALGKLPRMMHRRPDLVRGYALAFIAGDEYLKRTASVSGPSGMPNGPHLYNSVTPSWAVMPSAALDRVLHDGSYMPRVWRRYGARHTCSTPDVRMSVINGQETPA